MKGYPGGGRDDVARPAGSSQAGIGPGKRTLTEALPVGTSAAASAMPVQRKIDHEHEHELEDPGGTAQSEDAAIRRSWTAPATRPTRIAPRSWPASSA
jgi:hypothetical protein